MTQAVVTLQDGFAFQARIFWYEAARLLNPKSNISAVGFECGPQGFDDIWVEYDPHCMPLDHHGIPILRRYSQCKWHVAPGQYGHDDLIKPDFINATSHSFLQRAHGAYGKNFVNNRRVRFKLLTNWRIKLDDPMAKLLHQASTTLSIEKLFRGTLSRSQVGKMRKLWIDHLGITEDELRVFIPSLVFGTVNDSLDDLRENLDAHLQLVGLRGTEPGELVSPYDTIPYRWLGQGRQEFDRKSLRALCEEHRLIEDSPKVRVSFGIKSFEHPIDRLEDRCDSTLNFVSHFDDRLILKDGDWKDVLYPKLEAFLTDAAQQHENPRLILDAHTTLAFASGAIINIKSGRPVQLEQRGLQRRLWEAADAEGDKDWPQWQFKTEIVASGGDDIAVAVGLTHDIVDEVRQHVSTELPQVGKILVAYLSCGPGMESVKCGRHAFELARALTREIRASRSHGDSAAHVFIAGPNALTFFLGQHQPLLGTIVLYEYDFEGMFGGRYTASLRFPLTRAARAVA